MNAVAAIEPETAPAVEKGFSFRTIAMALIEPPAGPQASGGPTGEPPADPKGADLEARLARLKVREVLLSSFTTKERELITAFLKSHLSRAWRLPESGRTRSANFSPGSVVAACIRSLTSDQVGNILEESRKIAERLVTVTPAGASRGLLMVLPFSLGPRNYVGLFKLDPGAHDSIYLKEDDAGQMLLELAARRVAYELPEPGERVLKWAVIPHPADDLSQLKLRDEQGDREPAFYFVEFLECQDYESEGVQAATGLEVTLKHAKEKLRLQAARQGALRVSQRAVESPEPVSLSTLVQWVRETGLVKDEELADFEARLLASPAAGMRARPGVFERLRLTYKLSSGVEISGSLAAVLSQVTVARSRQSYSFSLDAQDYEIAVRQV